VGMPPSEFLRREEYLRGEDCLNDWRPADGARFKCKQLKVKLFHSSIGKTFTDNVKKDKKQLEFITVLC
ncbi:MAG: hypothetical protein J6033_00765, partial [Lachnospiraceae bacterium]|nr:hypothetical protein [Lachnospiraceae bacterium]